MTPSPDMEQAPESGQLTPVGGCNGVQWVPAPQVPDYYRAHAYVGIAAAALLAVAAAALAL